MAEAFQSGGCAGVVAQGNPFYRRNVQVCSEYDLCQGRFASDPSGLFNSSLEGNTRRAIDFHEADVIDEAALMELIRVAVVLNTSAKPENS